MGIKVYIIFAYILLNVVCGSFLSIFYVYREKGIKDIKEFLFIFLLPVYGFGVWQYNKMMRFNIKPPYPLKFYILKYLFRLHVFFYVIFLTCSIYIFVDMMSMFLQNDKNINHNSLGTETISYIGNAFLSLSEYLFITFFVITQIGIISILLVIPYVMLKNIKNKTILN